MAFRIGQPVVCIDDDPRCRFLPADFPIKNFNGELNGLKRGEIYTVRGHEDYYGEPTILLEEIFRSAPHEKRHANGYHIKRFRPVTDISIFTAMLKTKKIDA